MFGGHEWMQTWRTRSSTASYVREAGSSHRRFPCSLRTGQRSHGVVSTWITLDQFWARHYSSLLMCTKSGLKCTLYPIMVLLRVERIRRVHATKWHQTFDNSTIPPFVKWFGGESGPNRKRGFKEDDGTTRNKTPQIPA